MDIDQDRIREILSGKHSYYAVGNVPIREENLWHPGFFTDLIARQLAPSARVLDVGCGKGHILVELREHFQYGLGVDTDPDFLRMAEKAKQESSVQNIDFLLLDFPREASLLEPESFDLVMSIRGPLPDSAKGVQAAHRLLRPEGLLFCQEIAELHHIEEVESFWGNSVDRSNRRVDQVRALMEQNGFEVRLALDTITKAYFADFYTWLDYVSNIWAWLGGDFPAPDDPGFARFAGRHTTPKGEIKTTNHVCWVGAVKA